MLPRSFATDFIAVSSKYVCLVLPCLQCTPFRCYRPWLQDGDHKLVGTVDLLNLYIFRWRSKCFFLILQAQTLRPFRLHPCFSYAFMSPLFAYFALYSFIRDKLWLPAMYKGTERTRTFEVYVDDVLDTTWTSSGTTSDFESIDLSGTSGQVIKLTGVLTNSQWLSIVEVSLEVTIYTPQRLFATSARSEWWYIPMPT